VTTLNIAIITFVIGLVGWGVCTISLTILHKLKKLDSFVISEKNNKIIVKQSAPNIYLNSTGSFFLLSLFGFIILTTNMIKASVSIQLIIIYFACAIFSFVHFTSRKNFKIIIDRVDNSILLKKGAYSLHEYKQWVIDDRRLFWGADESTYALYIKNDNNKYKFVYGYSLYKDIEKLKLEIEDRLNSGPYIIIDTNLPPVTDQ
jgi:hypothetical protein